MDNKELKPRSFRVNEETAEKLKQITAEIGGNQQAALSKLIEAYEFQKGKAILTDKKEEIEMFEGYISLVTRMYMTSLENEESAVSRARIECDALLKSKDETILSLQEELKKVKEHTKIDQEYINKLEHDHNAAMESNSRISAELADKVANYEGIINDKDELNKALTEAYNSLKTDAAKQEQELQGLLEKESNYNKAVADREKAVHNLGAVEKKLKVQQQQHQDELEAYKEKAALNMEKALIEQEKTYNLRLQELQCNMNEEVGKYQAMYVELLQKFQNDRDGKKV